MPDFDLSITICSWNTIDDLRACLKSLREAKDEADFEVVVVDNASSDGSAEMAETEFPEFRTLKQKVNLGFTGGHNLALAERRGHHAALLNSDTVVHPGAIRSLMAFWEANPDVGVIGPKLLNPDGSLQYSCRQFPNPVAAAFRSTLLGRLFPNNKAASDYLMEGFGHDEAAEVDWVSGAALFIRGETLDQVGSLDDSFFMYCEDVDLCQRVWNADWKVSYVPDAVITHAIGRSSDKAPNKMIIRHHRSMLRYYRKHLIGKAFWLWRPFLTAAAAMALSLRAGAFLFKNMIDALRRSLSR